jgi:iron complex outermembrane recepter protein
MIKSPAHLLVLSLLIFLQALERNQLKVVFHYKRDKHQENNAGEPVRTFKDQITSFGLGDTVTLTGKLFVVVGLSVDTLDFMRAQDFQQGRVTEFPTEGRGETAVNPQAGIFYAVAENENCGSPWTDATIRPKSSKGARCQPVRIVRDS